MSKILMSKINNILDIDKSKEYINFSLQSYEDYINLELNKSIDEIKEFIDNNEVELELIFNENYSEILEKVKTFDDFTQLNEYLKNNEIDFVYESNFFNKKWVSQKKKVNKNKSKIAYFNEDDLTLMKEEFLHNKKETYDLIKKKILEDVEKFKVLNNKAKKLFIETGKNLLKVACSFIQGHINKNYIDAPLFLTDIDLEIVENKVKLIKKSKKKINEKLLIFLSKELNVDFKKIEWNQIQNENDFFKIIEPIIQYKILDVDDINNPINAKDSFRTLKCINTYFIGLFDTDASKIKEDFIEILSKEKILLNEKMKNDFEFYTNKEFEDKALIQINNPLNIFQKYAVRAAINENTLIYGPPGTGKSETITSIITNLLIKNKSILIVSEKDAALSVIKKRLKDLTIFAFYLKELEDEDKIYEQIENISFYMGSFYNENYKDEEFELESYYQNNDRIIDYNDEIVKFRKILFDDIDFSLERDSRNNDYKDYLLSIKEVEKFISNNKSGIEQFWKEYENKFVKLQSATEFISKVAEFNWFKEKYELNEEELKKLDISRQQLNKFIVENNEISFKLESFENIKNKVDQLENFLNLNLLNKDRDFITLLENDVYFLKNNYKKWISIVNLLENLKEKQYIQNFLFKYKVRHQKFLSKYISLSNDLKTNLINRYFYKAELSTANLIFKSKKKNDILNIFLKTIFLFEEIKIYGNNNYLNNLIKEDIKIFDPIIIYFYNHKELLKKSFIEFYNKQIINFDQRIIYQYYKYRVNQIERELININIYNFEKLQKNKEIIERDLPYLIDRYLKNNRDFILNLDKALKDIYLKNLKHKLAKLDLRMQSKIEQMFKVVRMEIKPKINDFIKEYLECLVVIFPIWISKPELISYYFPNKENIFDFGIFDEASQMFLEKSYPMIYRCKNIIVAGDDKQLKPERIEFNQYINDLERPLVSEVDFDLSESLLDRVKVSYWNTFYLRNHYRSESKELIEFSNIHFYDDKLIFSSINHHLIDSLEINTNLKAKEVDGINKEEAKSIYSFLKSKIEDYKKVLVICFSEKQKQYILDLISKEGNSNLIIRIKRKNLIIGDLSSIQGDEGDLVIISTVFSKESQNYGLLSSERGSNYLNVAITRSRQKLIIYKSLSKNDINILNDHSLDDVTMFKKWIEYLDQKSRQSKVINDQKIINEIQGSTFNYDIYNSLIKDKRFKNIKIERNLSLGSINIDLAFYIKSINNIDLIVILDNWKKNITIQDWFEDIDKEEYLKSRNYQVLRIREQDWLKDSERIINNIYSYLENGKYEK